MRQPYLIAYDMPDPNRRRRVLQLLRGYAGSSQKSLHECWLSETELRAIHADLLGLTDARDDRLLLTRLDPRAARHALGRAADLVCPNLYVQG